MEINEIWGEIHAKICPSGIWVLPPVVENLVKNEIRMLPQGDVSEQESRCPTTSAGMRSFLDRFFVRHYFQIQNAITKNISSEEQINCGRFRVLDIGSGPAVGILAVTEILKNIAREDNIIHTPVQLEFVCIEPSEICRSTGLKMANRYFTHLHFENKNEFRVGLSDISTPFPDCLGDLKSSSQNNADFQLILFSYVLNPLFDTYRIEDIQNGFGQLKSMLAPHGKILVIQDRFSEDRVKIAASLLGAEIEEQEITQKIYSTDIERKVQTYHYYVCRFEATRTMNAGRGEVVRAAG